jgi:DNA ligase-1
MLLSEVVETSTGLAGTRSRLKKAELIAGLLATATDPDETEVVVTYLSGELRQRRTGT